MATFGAANNANSTNSIAIEGTTGIGGFLPTFPEAGTLDSLHVYIDDYGVAYNGAFALYKNGDSATDPNNATLVEEWLNQDINTSPSWQTFTSASNPSLAANDNLYVLLKGYYAGTWYGTSVAGDRGDVTARVHTSFGIGQDETVSFPNPLASSGTAFTTSWGLKFYVTYTASGGGGISIPVVMHHRMLMGNG